MLGFCNCFRRLVAGQSQEVKDDQIACKIWICAGFPSKIPYFRQLQILLNMPRCRIKSDSATMFRPKFGDSATKIRYDSATKKDESATKLRAIQQPKSALLCNQDSRCYTLHGIVSKRGVGWGGGTITFLQLRSTLNMASWGVGVGWGGDNNVRANYVLGAALVSSCPWFRNHRFWFQNQPFWLQNHPWFQNHSTSPAVPCLMLALLACCGPIAFQAC